MPPPKRPSDAELLRASAADPGAFDAFYGRYERPLLGYFARRTHDPELTADLAAEVFAAALEHAGDFDPDRPAGSNAGPWLFAIAYHVLLASVRSGQVAADARRRVGMLERVELHDDSYERVEALASIELDIDALVAGLPDEQRVALIARIVDEPDDPDRLADGSTGIACPEPAGPEGRRARGREAVLVSARDHAGREAAPGIRSVSENPNRQGTIMHPHRTSGPPNTSRRAGDGGFTLVELLVVITILGILAGIVVFAVRGIGDRGQANAKLADANTLRTAEEANCAQHSQYATVDELVANKLLASADRLNAISLGDDQKCGNVPGRSSFSIFDPTAATQFLTGGGGVGSGIPVGSSPTDIAINSKTNRVYVVNKSSNSVSVIDGATDTVLGSPIAVGAAPEFIAVNPANNKIYVSNTGDNTVSVINGATNAVSPPLPFVAGGVAGFPGPITVNPVNN